MLKLDILDIQRLNLYYDNLFSKNLILLTQRYNTL